MKMFSRIKNHWLFKFPLDRYFSEFTPIQVAWWSLWRDKSYSPEEIYILNENIENWHLNQDLEKCKLAVNRNFKNISLVKDEFLTESFTFPIIKKHPSVLLYLKNPSKGELICALRLNPLNLKYIPEAFQTPELCLYCLERNPESLQYIYLVDTKDLNKAKKDLLNKINAQKNKDFLFDKI